MIVEGLQADAINAKLDLGETLLPLRKTGVETWTSVDRIRVERLCVANCIRIVHHRPGRRSALQSTAKVETAAIGAIIRGRTTVERPEIITASDCLDVGVGVDRQLEILAGVSAPDHDLMILEGFRELGTVQQARRFFAQKRLVAWGEELRLESGKLSERLAQSVMDRGLVASVLAPPLVKGHARVSLKERRKPSNDHAIWVSFEGSPLEESLVRVTIDDVSEDSRVWRFEAVRPIQLLAITFQGERIGSWWDTRALGKSLKSLERDRSRLDASKAMPAFALLRWARVALLADEVRDVVQKLALKRPYDFLLGWRGKEGLQHGLSRSTTESAHHDVVIRQLLWSWRPQEDRQARMLFETLSTAKSGRRHSGSFVDSLVEACDLCPAWLRQVYRFASENDSRDALSRVIGLSKESKDRFSRRRRRMVREGIISESLVDSWIAEKTLGREDETRLRRFAENPEGRVILSASTLTRQIESGAFGRN